MKRLFKLIINLFIIAALVGVICVGALFIYANNFRDDAFLDEVDNLTMNLATIVYAYDKNTDNYVEIERLHAGENRIWVDYEDIPQNMIDAFVAIEDQRFWTHKGVDWKRTSGAVLGFVTGNDNYGGSTITQQFIKNITGDKSHKPSRKVREIVRALQLEKRISKEDILELYLNTLYVGQNYYGVQAASQGYYGKDVSELSLAECASIAGITNMPTKYNPFLNFDNNKDWARLILSEMLRQEMISREEYDGALAQELLLNPGRGSGSSSSVQSYYVDQVITEVLKDLQEQKGYSYSTAEKMIYQGGLSIYCMMDIDVQDKMDEVFSDTSQFPKLAGEIQPEAAMVIIDPKTGDVAALYGGRGPKTGARVLNRAVQTKRPPGSTIKPISVYAPAIENNIITSADVIDDTPLYDEYPKNYYNYYRGLVTVKQAIEQSINTVATKVVDKMTPQVSYDFMTQKLHVTSLSTRDIDIAPLALGGLTNGMSVLELCAAYVPFDNDGIYVKPRIYSQVLDSKDNVILENKRETSVAMSSETAFIMSQMLQSVMVNGTGTPGRIKGGAQPSGGKTGTTDDDNDRWFVGYTPYYVGAVWFGYDTPKTVSGVSTNPALSLWKKVMDKVHAGLPNQGFPQTHEGCVTASYCKDSGLSPGPYCQLDYRGGRVATGLYKKGTEPQATCNVHYLVTIDKTTDQIASQYCPQENIISVALLNISRPSYVSTSDGKYVVNVGADGNIIYSSEGLGSLCSAHSSPPPPQIPDWGDLIPGNGEDDDDNDDHGASEKPGWLT